MLLIKVSYLSSCTQTCTYFTVHTAKCHSERIFKKTLFIHRRMILGLLKYFTLQVLLIISKYFNAISNFVIGYSLHSGWKVDKERSQNNYDHCAKRSRILMKARKFPLASPSYDSLFLVHKKYEHPRCIYENDFVTLIGFDTKRLLFCVSNIDVYDSNYGPFVFTTQYDQICEVS